MQTDQSAIEIILEALKIDALNAMQLAALEAAGTGKDVILLSNTGSGKTLGFLLPLLQELDPANKNTQALIVVPSRELALQIEQVFKSMRTGLKISCCYGGHKRETEENNLLQAPALIVGTAGRLADHLRRGNIKPGSITTVILDEFDKSIEMGFQEEVSFIIGSLPALKKRVLTSATDALDIPAFIGLNDPIRLDFLTEKSENLVAFQLLKSQEIDKINSLVRLICMADSRSAIVFCNHRDAVERCSQLLADKGIINVFYHGAMEQRDREVALCKFRNGTSNVLVTTDLASRGLDIANIRYIIHYHLPASEDVFTHRNGRTARVEASGTVIVILGPDEKMPGFIKEEMEVLQLPESFELPEKPKWSTLFIDSGKKDKINKVDIVGFLTNKGGLKKEDIGLIEVKDFFSFAAVRKLRVGHTLELIKNEKMKNRKIKIDIAR